MSNDKTQVKEDTQTPAWAIRLVDEDGDHTVYRLHDGFSVGRSYSCDLVLTEAGSSRNHAAFHFEGQRLFVTDQSTNGTYVNGVRVDKGEVQLGDIVAFDEARYEVLMAPEVARHARQDTGRRRAHERVAKTTINQDRVLEALARELKYVGIRRSTPPEEEEEDETPVAPVSVPGKAAAHNHRLRTLLFALTLTIVAALSVAAYFHFGKRSLSANAITEAKQIWVRSIGSDRHYLARHIAYLKSATKPEIVIASQSGKLRYVNPNDGLDLVSVDMQDKPAGEPLVFPWTASTPGLVVDETRQNFLLAFDASGTFAWYIALGGNLGGCEEPPVAVPGTSPRLGIAPTRNRGLVLFSVAGKVLGDSAASGPTEVITEPVVKQADGEDYVFAVFKPNVLRGFKIAPTGPVSTWSSKTSGTGIPNHLVLVQGDLVVTTTTGSISRFDWHTGASKWTTQLNTSMVTEPAAIGNQLYVFDIRGVADVIDFKTGAVTREFSVGNAVSLTPHVFGREIIIADTSGAISVVDSAKGDLISRVYVPGADSYQGNSVTARLDPHSRTSLISVSQNGIVSRVDFD